MIRGALVSSDVVKRRIVQQVLSFSAYYDALKYQLSQYVHHVPNKCTRVPIAELPT
jgi:hypothetical protein